jgi:Delta3-Delta2-enoyl-CoA isomerase
VRETACVYLDIGRDAHVLHLGDEQNVFDGAFVASLHDALDGVEDDDEAQCLITIGDGKAYTAGFDIDYLGSVGTGLDGFLDEAFRACARILTFPMPTVAALNGHAFGIGAVLALAHDQRVMNANRGWFCFPEVDLGLRFHPFMQAVFATKLAPSTVLEMLLEGKRYDGPSALESGIVDAVASPDELISTALSIAAARTGKAREIVADLKTDLFANVLATL